MILCIDIGNTSIKIAAGNSRAIGRVEVVAVDADERELSRAIARAARGRIERAAIASVRPAATAPVRRAVERELGVAPLVVTHRAEWPLEIATRRPERVGVDRLCAASGAIQGRRRHAIVVDAGTAITVDLVVDRRFLGGLIMAGPQTSLAALHALTAQLPELRMVAARGRIDDTEAAMQTGAVVGAAGAIEAAVRLLRARARRPVPVWLTGGDARFLGPMLPPRWLHDPHLTLRGLAAVSRLNGE